MENIQKSTIDFWCAALGCLNHQTVEFATFSEVVGEGSYWILPEGWREVEVRIGEATEYYICCPNHDIELVPSFTNREEAET